ncbi:cytochrome P450 [Podospora appendiculata]|uniref:Cytochrome P450 n=1 Tax=Podospora appendiculata TaxID=314037 RepID=A0AAE0XC51_9PEZI|nr:cytochrome P450 [Podospora appendiculata]
MPLLLQGLMDGLIGEGLAFETSYHFVLAVAVSLAVVLPITRIIYNRFFHPRRDVPGPLIQRASVLPFAAYWCMGKQPSRTQKLHDQYGPVVRKDIYGHLPTTQPGSKQALEMDKTTPFHRMFDDLPPTILNARREEHKHVQRALTHGFSETSLRGQEPLIVKSVNLLLQKLHEMCDANPSTTAKPINAEAWYNYTTFDTTGDLIFGTTFGCLDDSTYHPWITGPLKQRLHPRPGRGPPTSSHTHPDILAKLNHEVRSAFRSADEITMSSANRLPYLLAVINESLRMYPPVTSGLVREVPVGGGTIAWQYIPAGTFVEKDPWSFNPDRFLAGSTDREARVAGNTLEALQPFSLGPRNCTGRKYQWIERQKMHILWDRISLNVLFTPVKG